MNENKIYPSMVIRSQAEAIELLEKENKKLKEVNEKAKKYVKNHMSHNCGMNCADMNDLVEILDEVKEINMGLVSDNNTIKELFEHFDGKLLGIAGTSEGMTFIFENVEIVIGDVFKKTPQQIINEVIEKADFKGK